LKYLILVLPVDNNGEGGILALSARCSAMLKNSSGIAATIGMLGIALFFGDGIITPAISVLSAIEGLAVISPSFTAYVEPISILIIIGLFSMQRYGSGSLGSVFGYVMVIWFLVIGGLGVIHMLKNPLILEALHPKYGFNFLTHNGPFGFLALGGVILAVTGSEALYADMGHFGPKAIKIGWYSLVFPALILNYLGQGALLLLDPKAIQNPFYHMVPAEFMYPMVGLAALATIIASQSIISGIFSVSWHSVMLHYFPRLTIRHTSTSIIGQVYVPLINFILCILSVALILHFGSSSRLANAYGLSVAGTMLLTTLLLYIHHKLMNKWSVLRRIVVFTPLFILDSLFVSCCLEKFWEGAWIACVISGFVYSLIHVWMWGNKLMFKAKPQHHFNVQEYLAPYVASGLPKIPGVAVFFNKLIGTVPMSLATHLRQNQYLHETVILLSIVTEPYPKVAKRYHFSAQEVCPGVWQVVATYGYTQVPDISRIMRWAQAHGVFPEGASIWYILSRRILVIGKHGFIKWLGARVFRFLSYISLGGTEFYRIPHARVLEIGVHYKL
jgi:KUP system potassium uptake protein